MESQPADETGPADLTLEYTVSLEDHLDEMADLSVYYLDIDRWDLVKKTWIGSMFVGIAMLGVIWIYRAIRGGPPSHPDAVSVVIAAAVGLWTLYTTTSPAKRVKQSLPQLREVNKGNAGCHLGASRLTLSGDVVEFEDQHGTAIYPWGSVYEMRTSERGFTLLLANHRFVFVPSRADPDGRAAAFAAERFEAHGCPDPAAAGVLGGGAAVCPRCKGDLSGNRSAVCPTCNCRLSLVEVSRARCAGEEARRETKTG